MENWLDYIRARFDDDRVVLEVLHGTVEDGVVVRSANPGVKTRVFFWLPDGPTMLHDVQYFSAGTKSGSMDQFTEPLSFVPENVEGVERVLRAPLEEGWSERHYFIFGDVPFKRVVYYSQDDPALRGDFYDGGCLPTIVNLITLGLASRLAQKRDVEFDPLLPTPS